MAFINLDQDGMPKVSTQAKSWGYLMKARGGVDGMAVVARLVRRGLSVSALVAAASLWFLPGSDASIDLVAMKGAITIFLVMVTIFLWRSSHTEMEAEIHVDFVREEVRLVDVAGGIERLRKLYSFAELGAMHVEDHALHLFTEDGRRLAVLELDPSVEAMLQP
ncbi:MAG: hypothetical protein AAGH70_09945 [Pseudomonadota bacterium]